MKTISTSSNTSAYATYESELCKARQDFVNSSTWQTLIDPAVDPVFFELFLIYFNAIGVSMTEPVENWIQRAGEKCKQLGFTEQGHSLGQHAIHEAGHHQMMISDTKKLVDHWNASRTFTLNADEILAQSLPQGVHHYIQLHEDVIAGDAPFGQLAIELEVEGLSMRLGPSLIEQCIKVFGANIMEGMSFLEEHVALDVSHTHFNEKQLNKFLTQYPEHVDALINTGKAALATYNEFLSDCVDLAKAKAEMVSRKF